MSETEFTPGPWWIEYEGSGSYIILGKQGPIRVSPGSANGVSDAYLIAAAPDLYDAIQSILDWADFAQNNLNEFGKCGVENLRGPVFDKARSALAKARGEKE